MKKIKFWKQGLSLLLISSMVLGITACSSQETTDSEQDKVVIEPMEMEDVYSYSFDYIGGKDVMPILSYYTQNHKRYSNDGNNLPDFMSDEIFQMIKDCGVNILGKNDMNWSSYEEHYVKLLEMGDEYGLGIMVNDDRVIGAAIQGKSLREVDDYIKDYANYPAYIGNNIVDEPTYTELSKKADTSRDLTVYAESFKKLINLGVYAYGNLLPYTVGNEEGYKKYLSAYMELCSPQALSYDFYPFNEGDNYNLAKNYFTNLTMIREAAETYKKPFWVFIQAGAQWNDDKGRYDSDGYFPSQGSFYWNVGTSLAFGAKGLQYFPIIQPEWFAWAETEYYDFQRNGLIGAAGNKTRWYYYAQAMNKQIAAVDEVLMNSVNKGVIATGELAQSHLKESSYLMQGDSWRELKNVEGDTLIGCFNYNGKTALYVVNYDIEYAQNITLNLQDTYKMTVIQDAEKNYVSTDSLELTLSAGNSALIVFD